MDFQVRRGSDINLIFKVLDQEFPKSIGLEKLRVAIEKEGAVRELEKYLVYLEDKNWIKKEAGKFRITGYGLDIYHEVKI